MELRKWRLHRKRQLDIEPFKIFQNRTLCDVIRRRRNDPQWATSTDRAESSKDFLMCWGIGPSKVNGCSSSDEGFAHELRKVLDNAEILKKLKESVDLETSMSSLGVRCLLSVIFCDCSIFSCLIRANESSSHSLAIRHRYNSERVSHRACPVQRTCLVQAACMNRLQVAALDKGATAKT